MDKENNKKQSICKRIIIFTIPLWIFMACFMICLIFGVRTHNKTMERYEKNYYIIAETVFDVDTFENSMSQYINNGSKDNLETVQKDFSVAREAFRNLHTQRFSYSDTVRDEIEKMNEVFIYLSNVMEDITDYSRMDIVNGEYSQNISPCISEINVSFSKILAMVSSEYNDAYTGIRGKIVTSEVLLGISGVGIVLWIVVFVLFIRRKIITPIRNVTDWTRLFNEGYAEMADLTFENNDEFKELYDSFNFVKKKLFEANSLIKENEDALLRLRREEEHKQKFVEKLYAEKREKENISVVAKHDGLTGLFNRRTFDIMVDEFMSRRPEGVEGALYLIDMDYFKGVNDTMGHLAGDEALKTLAGVMRIIFPEDYLGRYGGDEFVVFIHGYKSEEQITNLAAELVDKMDRRFEMDGKAVNLSVSVGIALSDGVSEYSELYMRADKALYTSKENGRNRYTLYSDNL